LLVTFPNGYVLSHDENLVFAYHIYFVDGHNIRLVYADEIFGWQYLGEIFKALYGIDGFITGFQDQVVVESFDVIDVIKGEPLHLVFGFDENEFFSVGGRLCLTVIL
jgi:hypothetical protein